MIHCRWMLVATLGLLLLASCLMQTHAYPIDGTQQQQIVMGTAEPSNPPKQQDPPPDAESDAIETHNGDDKDATEDDRINVDTFAQVVASHWQFDHLDALKTKSHKEMADRIQHHIHIDIHTHDDDKKANKHGGSGKASDAMEHELLKSQMLNAIQARTQGLLPEVWDEVGDALGRPCMEAYVQQLVQEACHCKQGWVLLSCLQTKAEQLTHNLDDYVQDHLDRIWSHMESDVLPHLLQRTSRELEQVVSYFNDQAFFSNPITLNILPWQSPSQTDDNSPLALSSLDDHFQFANFLVLAKL